MAATTGTKSNKSILLEIAIVILIIILLTAILYPKKLWNDQAAEARICRDRMENLFLASEFQRKAGGGLSSDLARTMAFAESQSVTIPAAGFKMDRLTREDSGIDSFLVDYFDPYQHFSHYDKAPKIEFQNGKKSVVLTLVPKKEYPFVPVTSCTFSSEVPITAVIDDRGDQGVFTLVGAQGRISVTQQLGEPKEARAADYIYFIDIKNMTICPTTESTYKVGMNMRVSITADIVATLEKNAPEKPLIDSRLLASNVVFRLLKEADAAAKREITEGLVMENIEDSLLRIQDKIFLDSIATTLNSAGKNDLAIAIYDSTLDTHPLADARKAEWDKIRESSYDHMNMLKNDSVFASKRDEIVNFRKSLIVEDKFSEGVARLRSEKAVNISESGIISTLADSVEYYSRPDVIAARLIREHADSITVAYMSRNDIQDLLKMFSYTESYLPVKADSIGLTISCPIEGKFEKLHPSILDRLFSVGGASNHGNIRNGDLSWSEKR